MYRLQRNFTNTTGTSQAVVAAASQAEEAEAARMPAVAAPNMPVPVAVVASIPVVRLPACAVRNPEDRDMVVQDTSRQPCLDMEMAHTPDHSNTLPYPASRGSGG
jgi:hypothetical protein